jgi:hypothetical protein
LRIERRRFLVLEFNPVHRQNIRGGTFPKKTGKQRTAPVAGEWEIDIGTQDPRTLKVVRQRVPVYSISFNVARKRVAYSFPKPVFPRRRRQYPRRVIREQERWNKMLDSAG